MGSIINLASNVVLTTGTYVGVRLLPLGIRVPSTFTITTAAAGTSSNISITAAATAGATSLTVGALTTAIPAQSKIYLSDGTFIRTTASAASAATTLTVNPLATAITSGTTGSYTAGALTAGTMFLSVTAIPTPIDAGDRLVFGAVTVTVSDFAPAGSTVLEVLPTTALLTAGTTATTNALQTVASVTSVSPEPDRKIVETTSMASGSGMERLATATGQKMNLAYQIVQGAGELQDRGGAVLTQIIYDPEFFNREIYVRMIRQDGTYQGAAMVTDAPQQGDIQDKVVQTCNLQFQGTSFSRIAA
jgi:hypothetical protein